MWTTDGSHSVSVWINPAMSLAAKFTTCAAADLIQRWHVIWHGRHSLVITGGEKQKQKQNKTTPVGALCTVACNLSLLTMKYYKFPQVIL